MRVSAMISKSRPQRWMRWSRRHGASPAAMAPASWAPVLAAASWLLSSAPRSTRLCHRWAARCLYVRPPTARLWLKVERLLVLADAAALGGHARAQRLGGGVDATGRRRGGGPDGRSELRLEADRGSAPAVGARRTPVGVVSNRVPTPRPFRSRRAAHWRRVPCNA